MNVTPSQEHLEEDPLLDAARATVLDFGMRRATVSEVARRAGVSRMTVYRRFPEAAELLRALMAREFGGVLTAAIADTAHIEGDLERLVAELSRGVERLITHPVFLRILEVDAEAILPYMTQQRGRFQELAVARLAELIEAGQRAGEVRDGDPVAIADGIELQLRGIVLAARSFDDEQRANAIRLVGDLLERQLRAP
jgi:AcrR family transcriptional regulator